MASRTIHAPVEPGDRLVTVRRKRGSKPTIEQRFEMARRYEAGESAIQVGRAFGFSAVAVCNYVRRSGGKVRSLSAAQRRYSLNEAAFSEITEQSAYWIGFLMADGCINRGALTVALAAVDAPHLDAFRAFLGTDRPITFENNSTGKSAARVEVNSAKIVADLARFGVVARKSNTAKVMGLAADRHFWRGVVDGDGWLGLINGKYPSLHLHGSLPLMEQFADFARGAAPQAKILTKPHKSIFRVALAGSTAAAVLSLLYPEAKVALQRKAAIARQMLAPY